MKVRAVANGNIIDLPEDHGLIAAGIYEPVEDEEEEDEKKPARQSALQSPEKPVETVAHTAKVMTTESALAQPTRARRQRKKK